MPLPVAYPVMFHYFHGGDIPPTQGSISAEGFSELIEAIGSSNVLPANVWFEKWKTDRLRDREICLTFDDNLSSQWRIALPVLEYYGLTAFWFINTSSLGGQPERLELYRYFRNMYGSMEDFYTDFYNRALISRHAGMIEKGVDSFPESYLAQNTYYSREDRLFRYIRDQVLGQVLYYELMDEMIATSGTDMNDIVRNLWIDESMVKKLHSDGHILGLHSHSHPTSMASLSYDEQWKEYTTNFDILSGILGEAPRCMAHPCNSYNKDSLRVLQKLGIELGFRADQLMQNPSNLEFPRVDFAECTKLLLA